jgi:uncharacterized protein YjiS (DUF1127 family)
MWSYTEIEDEWLSARAAAMPAREQALRGLRGAYALVMDWVWRARSRAWLARMDARELHDLNITAWEAELEAAKPFWNE